MRIEGIAGSIVAALALGLTAAAAYAVSPADGCEAAKLKIAGKYDFCRFKAEAKAAKTGTPADFSKCDLLYAAKWTQVENAALGACPTNGDQTAVQSFIAEHTDALGAALGGGTLGDGVETCNADLATCETQPFGLPLKTGQMTCWNAGGTAIPCAGTGQDGELQKGQPRSYVDNGDGTITDLQTNLTWEKLSYDGTIHDWTRTFTWTAAFSTKIAMLNSDNFGGHADWRLPNRNELETLLNLGNNNPSIDAIFHTACALTCMVTDCSCTQPGFYWTSTSAAPFPGNAWLIGFYVGDVSLDSTSNSYFVRGVRGGS